MILSVNKIFLHRTIYPSLLLSPCDNHQKVPHFENLLPLLSLQEAPTVPMEAHTTARLSFD